MNRTRGPRWPLQISPLEDAEKVEGSNLRGGGVWKNVRGDFEYVGGAIEDTSALFNTFVVTNLGTYDATVSATHVATKSGFTDGAFDLIARFQEGTTFVPHYKVRIFWVGATADIQLIGATNLSLNVLADPGGGVIAEGQEVTISATFVDSKVVAYVNGVERLSYDTADTFGRWFGLGAAINGTSRAEAWSCIPNPQAAGGSHDLAGGVVRRG